MGELKYRIQKVSENGYTRYYVEKYGIDSIIFFFLIIPVFGWLIILLTKLYQKKWHFIISLNKESAAKLYIDKRMNPEKYRRREETIYEV